MDFNGKGPEFSRLVAAISHEINSPASNITGFTRLLSTDQQAVMDEHTRDILGRIRRNSSRLTHLIREAGTLVRLLTGEDQTERSPTDLKVLIEGALKDTSEVVGTGEWGPLVELSNEEAVVAGDAVRLRTAIGGLLMNLAKDLNSRRMVLKLERSNGSFMLTVSHASTEGDDFTFTLANREGGGPSAVVVTELFKTLGCGVSLYVSPEAARKIVVTIPA